MTVNRERLMVLKRMESLDLDCSTLGSALETIQCLIDKYGPDAMICEYNAGYSDDKYLAVSVKVPETDQEMAKRIREEEQWEANKTARDRAEFERLKAKFGDK
jgi:hypothetical protein